MLLLLYNADYHLHIADIFMRIHTFKMFREHTLHIYIMCIEAFGWLIFKGYYIDIYCVLFVREIYTRKKYIYAPHIVYQILSDIYRLEKFHSFHTSNDMRLPDGKFMSHTHICARIEKGSNRFHSFFPTLHT